MTDRPASWRMPTPKKMDKLAAEVARRLHLPPLAPDSPLPAEYWDALLNDPRVRTSRTELRQQRLSDFPRHLLRVSCRRCARIVEIQKADAVRLYGPDAAWKVVVQRLLDNTCQQRTGRLEEDGCWPGFEAC